MNKYTIYCTEAQTKKAFELGAPLEFTEWYDDKSAYVGLKGEKYAIIPTAEQLIGWLEGRGGIEDITICKTGMWIWGKKHTIIEGGLSYSSRKEATLAAVDTALEYLNNKLIK